MELRHLRYFVAVGEEQHFGRAAERLHLAQPALSRQIQDLEDEIGFKLFERLPRGVKISAAGKSFLEDARRILQQVNEATLRAGRVASGKSLKPTTRSRWDVAGTPEKRHHDDAAAMSMPRSLIELQSSSNSTPVMSGDPRGRVHVNTR